MRFQIDRTSGEPPTSKHLTIEEIPFVWRGKVQYPEYFVEIETLEDLMLLLNDRPNDGLVLFPAGNLTYSDVVPAIEIYDYYRE